MGVEKGVRMEWNFKDGIPIYTQIVDKVKVSIAGGLYEPGAKMPPVRDMALEAGVNPNTMQKAFTQLEREGLLYSVRTSGRFVTEEREVLDNLKKTLSREYINELFESLSRLGMSREEIITAVQQWSTEE